MTTIIKGHNIHTETKILPYGAITIDSGIIRDISLDIPHKSAAEILELPDDWQVLPGMIDVHVHGAAGADTMDATPEALATISDNLVKEGVTSFVATTMTATNEDIATALKNAQQYLHSQNKGAEFLGVNVEGPFLAATKAGAQQAELLQKPDIKLVEKWLKLAPDVIKIVSVAPELANSCELIKFLTKNNIITSIGHSDATLQQAQQAIASGATEATHLFNAMHALHHREPGIAGACLLDERVYVELIADGIHVHPAMLQMTLKLKGKDKILLITDAMRAKYLQDGEYLLGGQKVYVADNKARLSDGTLAGSILRMDQALRNMVQFTNCSLTDAIKMVAVNPAKHLGVYDRKGSIAVNKDADLVILDADLNARMTVCRGIVHQI